MKLFLDTADINEIKELARSGLVDGITTNPSLIAKTKRDFKELIKEICWIIEGPVSAEVISTSSVAMIEEGCALSDIAENVVVKLPLTWDGLIACKALSQKQIKTNLTLCFSANQALFAAKAGATYVSPFIGRLDDVQENGMGLIDEIMQVYSNYPDLKTQVLAASIRSLDHIRQASLLGAHAATIPSSLMQEMAKHRLTDAGLAKFLNDWKEYERV